MDIEQDWNKIRHIFSDSFKSSLHFSIASVTEQGLPHLTPIGSLFLTTAGRGFYFEKFTQTMPANFQFNQRVVVLAVNSSKWFWAKSLFNGNFAHYPALRLHGTVSSLREATEQEIKRWQRRVSATRWTKGHKLMWREMSQVRDVQFDQVSPIKLGKMTKHL